MRERETTPRAALELDAVVSNLFRDDPAALAEWTTAGHTERAPRRGGNGNGAISPANTATPAHIEK